MSDVINTGTTWNADSKGYSAEDRVEGKNPGQTVITMWG